MKKIIKAVSAAVLIGCICSTGAYARSGGGRSRSHHSSSHSSRSSYSSHRTYRSNGRYGNSSGGFPIVLGGIIISGIFISFFAGKTSLKNKRKIFANNNSDMISKTHEVLEKLKMTEFEYSDEELTKTVRDAYFIMQKGWTNMDLDICREYMSNKLFMLHTDKIDAMRRKNERNVLKNIKLINAVPVSVEHHALCVNDLVWFRIDGSMTDYTINTITNDFLYGNKADEEFIEYWKVIREDNKWVIDEIRQSDEISVNNFNIVCE